MLLRVFGPLALVLILISPHAAHSIGLSTCDAAAWGGNCNLRNTGTQVNVGGSTGRSGTGGSGAHHSAPATPESEPFTCADELCRGGYSVITVPDVTLADLASFVPARPSLSGEPKNLGVVGMPTNFVAAAREQRMSGRVLGFDVVVRFRPAGFVFDYGDGSTRRSDSGGASWAGVGEGDFTPTATSHVYHRAGTYTARVTALFTASVDFGSGVWHPVDGFVRATTGGYTVRVVEVRTALVDRTCLENPRGPGC